MVSCPGIDVDEHRPFGLQGDRQLSGKQGSIFPSPDGTTTWLHATGCVYHMVCPKVVSRVTRWSLCGCASVAGAIVACERWRP